MEKFAPVGEKDVTRAIVSGFVKEFNEYVESDCIIIGGGPSGLTAGRNLARAGKKSLSLLRWRADTSFANATPAFWRKPEHPVIELSWQAFHGAPGNI
ncbi:FAD-dependent monooxygenase [Chloroflexota bacterium]